MNDPHVATLIYRVEHSDDIDYENAQPLKHEFPEFTIRIADLRARADMKVHCATEDQARSIVEPALRAWELDVALRTHVGHFELRFERSEIVDRSPEPWHMHAEPGHYVIAGSNAKFHLSRSQYPPPPSGIRVDDAARVMFQRYRDFKTGRTTLPDAAYFCLTVVEDAAFKQAQTPQQGRKPKKRPLAAKHFGIDEKVLDELGRLTTEGGGVHARKASGVAAEFTGTERAWLVEAMKVLITRAAEVAHDSQAARNVITLASISPQI